MLAGATLRTRDLKRRCARIPAVRSSSPALRVGLTIGGYVLLIVLFVGCSDTNGNPPASATVAVGGAGLATPGQTPALTVVPPDALVASLLVLADLSPDWVNDPAGSAGATGYCLKPELDEVVKPLRTVQVAFKQRDSGPFLAEMLRLYDSGGAQRAITHLRELVQSCSTFTRTSVEGTELTYTLTPLAIEGVGDETLALRLTATGVPRVGTINVNYVFWRRGDILALIDYTTVGDVQTANDLLADLAARANVRVVVRPKK